MADREARAVGPPALPGSAAHVFVSDLHSPEVDEVDARHLAGALRLRRGETVTASDGQGRWRTCKVSESGHRLRIVPEGEIAESPRPRPAVEIGIPLLKGSRLDWAVQKCTEVGVDRIVLLETARAVVRWTPEQRASRIGRLRRIAREAAMQSRRAWLPELDGLTAVADLVSDDRVAGRAALAQRDGARPGLARPFILVGPEGGFDPAEVGGDLPRVGFGPTILRSETAALAGSILLCSLRWV